MTTKNGRWVRFARRLASELHAKPEITLTVEEIKEATGTRMIIDSLRDRGYWNSCRKGRRDFDAQTNAGLSLQEHLDGRGRVVAVTYRLAGLQGGAPLTREPIRNRPIAFSDRTAEVNAGTTGRDEDSIACGPTGDTSLVKGNARNGGIV